MARKLARIQQPVRASITLRIDTRVPLMTSESLWLILEQLSAQSYK